MSQKLSFLSQMFLFLSHLNYFNMVPAMIIAGGALAASGVSAASAYDSNTKNLRTSAALMQLQHGYELENLYRERDVNKELSDYSIDPRRFEALGLNPHLAVQQGVGSVGSASAGSSVSSPNLSYVSPLGRMSEGLMSGLQPYLSAIQLDKDLELKDAQRDLLREQGVSQNIRNQFESGRQILELANLRQTAAESLSREKVNSESYKQIAKNIEILDQQLARLQATYEDDVQAPKVQNEAQRAIASYHNALAITENLSRSAKIRNLHATTSSLMSSVREAAERIKLLGSQKKLTDQQVDNMVASEAKTWLEAQGVDNNNKMFPLLQKRIQSEIKRNLLIQMDAGLNLGPFGKLGGSLPYLMSND